MQNFHWLKKHSLYPKIYFESRCSNFDICGVGEKKPQHPHSYFFLKFFEQNGSDFWKHFPEGIYCPAVIKKGFQTTAPVNPFTHLKPDLIVNTPDFTSWKRNIEKAKKLMKKGFLQKVVLARQSTFSYSQKIDPFYFLEALKIQKKNSFLLFFQPSIDEAFISFSPERLYLRQDRHILSEAIAGTKHLGNTLQENHKLKQELLKDPKEQNEFSFVKNFVQEKLHPLCKTMQLTSTKVIETSDVQHLCNLFSGHLHRDINDEILIHTLHPTPATLGIPCDTAYSFLNENESFSRGLYAGCFGWIQPDRTEITVGIRSALIKKNELHIFAGTGIVAESDPEKEWQELENKTATFRKLLCL